MIRYLKENDKIGNIKILVDRIPEIPEYCSFSYDKIERICPDWCEEGYDIPVNYCGFTRKPCEVSSNGCDYLFSFSDIVVFKFKEEKNEIN